MNYCSLCQTADVCAECDESFELVEEDNICKCPTDTTLYEMHCYDCDIDFCNLCQEDGVCSECLGELIPVENDTLCGCPETYEQANDTCSCPEGTIEND